MDNKNANPRYLPGYYQGHAALNRYWVTHRLGTRIPGMRTILKCKPGKVSRSLGTAFVLGTS